MLVKLDAFKARLISLSQLVSDLEGLYSVLESAEDEWKDDFWKEWGTLELTNAERIINSSGEGFIGETENAEELISQAVTNLKALVMKQLQLMRC